MQAKYGTAQEPLRLPVNARPEKATDAEEAKSASFCRNYINDFVYVIEGENAPD